MFWGGKKVFFSRKRNSCAATQQLRTVCTKRFFLLVLSPPCLPSSQYQHELLPSHSYSLHMFSVAIFPLLRHLRSFPTLCPRALFSPDFFFLPNMYLIHILDRTRKGVGGPFFYTSRPRFRYLHRRYGKRCVASVGRK